MEPVITLTDAPDEAAKAVISGALNEFNDAKAGFSDRRSLAILVSDPETQKVVGGLLGRTSLGVLFIELFYLPENLRGNGLGRHIVQQAEDEARQRGCINAVLFTISFQAPGFYERCGYRNFGEIQGAKGISRFFMTKALV
ncbi:MAG TPA: GNAT family N-acetyltransferase [Caulobacteraceae bacterium]|nr:GNAT family N-acetyltransferase [Caulobacteraceae bacterium]